MKNRQEIKSVRIEATENYIDHTVGIGDIKEIFFSMEYPTLVEVIYINDTSTIYANYKFILTYE